MSWFSKFIKFINSPPKVNEAKKAEVIKKAVKDATVTLKPLDKAITEGNVISAPKRTKAKKEGKSNLGLVPKAWAKSKAPKKKTSKPKSKVVKVKKKK
mgnify:FL=1|jgi:hypothetical protein